MDIRQSKFWYSYLEKLGWKKLPIISNNAYIRKILFGSIVKIPRVDSPISFKEFDKLAKKESALFVKLEPNVDESNKKLKEELMSSGFKEDTWSLQPTKTIQIDLSPSEEELINNMEKDTRYSIRRAQREGVVVEKSEDIDTFLLLHKETSKRQRFWVSTEDSKALWDSLPDENREILLAKKNGEILAGAFLIFFDNLAYYY